MRAGRERLAVIGAGRAGSALARALRSRAWRITAIASRRIVVARRLASRCGATIATADPVRAAAAADAVLIAVPDREIPRLAKRLAAGAGRLAARTYLHTAGVHGAEVLAPLRARGFRTGSFHPLLALPPSGATTGTFEGASFAIDGDPGARRLARALAASLGGRAIDLPAEQRAQYHLAACFGSNYVVTLVSEAVALMMQAGIPRRRAFEAVLPLVRSTLAALESVGLPGALTGPVSRGDTATIARHAAALGRAPAELRELHRALVLRTARLARAAGWIDRAAASRLARALRSGRKP